MLCRHILSNILYKVSIRMFGAAIVVFGLSPASLKVKWGWNHPRFQCLISVMLLWHNKTWTTEILQKEKKWGQLPVEAGGINLDVKMLLLINYLTVFCILSLWLIDDWSSITRTPNRKGDNSDAAPQEEPRGALHLYKCAVENLPKKRG